MTILVIGGSGQLGNHLRDELPQAEFWDRNVVDLSNIVALESRLKAVHVDAIVIAAAYTAVDKAESERELAWRINAEAPAALARAAAQLDVPVIYISTDYVFDGANAAGYLATDATGPLNEYGRSKLGGEQAVAAACRKCWILRTSWLFSEHGHNFPKTILRLACERDQLQVVDDQRGRPTYAGDLARAIRMLLTDSTAAGPAIPWGLHHVGGGPEVSWMEFAVAIVERAAASGLLPKAPTIRGIPTSEHPASAQRPRHSVLQTRDSDAGYTRTPFNWERGVDRVVDLLSRDRRT